MHTDRSEQRLAPYIRHAELFGTECVYETAQDQWVAEVVARFVARHRDLRKRLPRPRDIGCMTPAASEQLFDERESVFADYRASYAASWRHLRDELNRDLLRLRVELDMLDARGPRWRRNAHKPTSAAELKRAVATLSADGLPPIEIARELNLRAGTPPLDGVKDVRPFDVAHVESLRARARTMGARRRRRTGEETAAAVAALWHERPNTTAIAGKLGISPKRVQQLLVEQGLLGGAKGGGNTPSYAGVFVPRVPKVEVQGG